MAPTVINVGDDPNGQTSRLGLQLQQKSGRGVYPHGHERREIDFGTQTADGLDVRAHEQPAVTATPRRYKDVATLRTPKSLPGLVADRILLDHVAAVVRAQSRNG